MNKLPKKLLSVVLSVSLLLGCAPFAFAAGPTTFDVNDIKYAVTGENTVAVISNTGDDTQHSTYTGDITIPATVDNDDTTYNVTEIGAIAFEQSAVTKVTLPTSITKIGNGAFYQCATVTEIVLNEGLLEIDAGAFNDCTSLATLTIPSTVTTLGRAAFGDCDALTALNIPKSVTSGVLEALADTNNEYPHLDAVTIEEGGTYSLQDGILYEGNDLVYRLDYNETVIDVRDGVTEIPDYAFGSAVTIQGRPVVTSVTLPSSVKAIGEGAFQGADITSIDLTDVTSIGMNAFKGCDNLANVTWPASLSTMGESAFEGCSALKNIDIAGSLTEIPDFAFNGCAGLESIVLPEGIARIGSYAFTLWDADCNNSNNLSYINIPDSVTSLGSVFLGGLESGTKAALIFKRTTLPTFEVDDDELGALDGISPDMEMGTPAIYYPAEARSAYEKSENLEDLLPKDTNDNFVGAYGITPPALTSVKPMAADAEATDANKLTFTADVPTGAELTVSSNNESIATAEVGTDGKTITVTGVASGDATITATITLTGTDFVLVMKDIDVTVLEQGKEPAVVVPAEPETKNEVTGTKEETTMAESVANELKPTSGSDGKPASDGLTVSQDKLTAAAEAISQNNTVTAEEGKTALGELATDQSNVTIVIQPYLDITVKDVTIAGTDESKTTTLTLDITPKYQTVATTANLSKADPEEIVVKKDGVESPNAVVIDDEGGTLNLDGETVEVKIPLPESFVGEATELYVTHLKNSRKYVYQGSVADNILSFTNPHGFSTFTITAANPTVAVVNGTNYTSLQDALDEAPNDATIELKQGDLSGTMYTDGKTVTVKNGTEKQIKVTLNGKEYTLAAEGTQELTYTRPSSGGGSSSSGTYAVTVENSKHGTVTVSPKRADKGGTVTITVKPDKGYELDELVVLDENGDEVKLTKTANNKYTFKMPASKVEIEATFAEIVTEPVEMPFTDVPDGIWYEDGVRFAYENGMMAGTSATTFAPELTTTRGMIVTILYRLENSPAAGVAAFDDVAAGQYYTDAVAWAAENGIVGGYGNGKFGPNDPITREQMATILYRYAQVKGYDTTARADLSGYTDAASINAYAVDAIAWANAEGLVNGTSATTLTPGGSATRAQVAVILMRFCENVVE